MLQTRHLKNVTVIGYRDRLEHAQLRVEKIYENICTGLYPLKLLYLALNSMALVPF